MRRPAEMVMVIRYTNPLACGIKDMKEYNLETLDIF